MSRLPSPASLRICVGIQKGVDAYSGPLSYWATTKVVYLHTTPIIKVIDYERELVIDLGGWGDTRATRSEINSILMRLGFPLRVGQHKSKRYLYKVEPGRPTPVALLQLPASGPTHIYRDGSYKEVKK